MGDRANVVFNTVQRASDAGLRDFLNGSIVLYSHWGGSERGSDLAKALQAARGRWDDPAYGTRIIVSRIVGDEWKNETGFGLTVGEFCDNERPEIVVDFADKRVVIFGRGARREFTFEQFAAMSGEQAEAAHLGHREDA